MCAEVTDAVFACAKDAVVEECVLAASQGNSIRSTMMGSSWPVE
jgi:hypothetical protein